MDYTNCRLCPRECGVNRAGRRNRLLRLPGYRPGGQNHAPYVGRAGSGRLRGQRRPVLRRLHPGLQILPERRHQRRPRGHCRGFRRTAPDFRRPDRPGGGEHRSRHPHPLSSHHPACPGAQAPGAGGVQLAAATSGWKRSGSWRGKSTSTCPISSTRTVLWPPTFPVRRTISPGLRTPSGKWYARPARLSGRGISSSGAR